MDVMEAHLECCEKIPRQPHLYWSLLLHYLILYPFISRKSIHFYRATHLQDVLILDVFLPLRVKQVIIIYKVSCEINQLKKNEKNL